MLKIDKEGIMAKLFIYYSYTGNGDFAAEYLKVQGCDIRKVERKKKFPKSFFFGVLHGGFLATIKYKDKLVDFDTNIEAYDEIIIGSPIWNGRISSPINSVLAQLDLKDKKVSFVFYSGSGEGVKAAQRVTQEYPNAKIVFLKAPKRFPEELAKLKEV